MKVSLEEFIERLQQTHNKSIQYISGFTGMRSKVSVQCTKCNFIWITRACDISSNRGCLNCKQSKGERTIAEILSKNNISYLTQYRLESIPKLPFDFAILNSFGEISYLIEYDGIQHYKPIKCWGGETRLQEQQRIDDLKNKSAYKKGLEVKRIPYNKKEIILEDLI